MHSNYFYKLYDAGNNNHAYRLNVENENSGEEGRDTNLLGQVSFKDDYVMFKNIHYVY